MTRMIKMAIKVVRGESCLGVGIGAGTGIDSPVGDRVGVTAIGAGAANGSTILNEVNNFLDVASNFYKLVLNQLKLGNHPVEVIGIGN